MKPLLALVLATGAAARADVTIAPANGGCAWSILVQTPDGGFPAGFDLNRADIFDHQNAGYEDAAAHELADLMGRMIGVSPAVVEVQNAAAAAAHAPFIAVGRLAIALGATPPRSKFGFDGSVVIVAPDRILLAGETAVASYYAMTRLAEMAGCRWYAPGAMGEVIPKLTTIALREGRFEEVPAVWSRMPWADNAWCLHNRLGGVAVGYGHVWAQVMPPAKYFKDHPEWYALRDGRRVPLMLCTTNREMTKQFVENYKRIIAEHPERDWFSLCEDDGVAYCQCPACTALDAGMRHPLAAHMPEMTDRLMEFFNRVITELVKEYPDKYFTFYAYGPAIAPPVREKPHPHLMPMIAPIDFSRYHAMDAGNSDSMPILRDYVMKWSELCECIGYYGYAFNLGDGIFPYTRETQTKRDLPFLARHRLACITMCMAGGFGQNHLPWYWLYHRLAIDPNLDADALLDEFYVKFFGPAAPDMRAYMILLREAYDHFDYEIGNQWFAPLLFTPELMRQLNAHLTAAAARARGDDLVTRRIAMWRFAYDNGRDLLRMRAQTNAFRFAAASATADRIYARGLDTIARNPLTGDSLIWTEWWKVFWKNPLNLCAEKLKGATILRRLPDEWHAWVDYAAVGEQSRLFRPDFPLTRWIKLKTYSQTLSEQGLSRFHGTIWYRSSFTLDAQTARRPAHLLFAGYDNRIDLYVNGRKVGRQSGVSFDAADFAVTGFLRAGENVVVCAVNNENITELETGGIMRPVVLYAPAAD